MTVHTYKFRVLIIDDDTTLIEKMESILKGLTVTIGNRKVRPHFTLLPVVVETVDGAAKFTDETLDAVLGLRKSRFDFIMIDFAFADPDRQAINWGQTQGEVPKSNAHMLSFDLLRTAAIDRAIDTRRGTESDIDGFFHRNAEVLLRSFQHDREVDILGSFDNRRMVVEGIFGRQVRTLNPFESVYGSDPTLREELYQKAPNRQGRVLYRNIVMTISQLQLELAMTRFLALRAGRLPVLRRSVTVAIFIAIATAIATVVQAVSGVGILEGLKTGDYVSAGVALIGAVVAIALVSLIGTALYSKVVDSMLDTTDGKKK